MNYSLHNLINIELDDSLVDVFCKSLDFQIGYFKNKISIDDPIANIKIYPYSQFSAIQKSFFDISEFHHSKGVKGKCFFNHEKSFAIHKTIDGFDIYADGPNFLINLYIQLLLYMQGYSMVHSGGYASKDGITLVAGPGGVGKTALLGYMVNRYGCKILGDDIVIVRDDGECLSFPRAFVFKEYHRDVYPELFEELKVPKWSTYEIKRFIIENIPFTGIIKNTLRKFGKYHAVAEGIGLDPYLATVSVEKIFGNDSVLDVGMVNKVVFIERYNGSDFICEKIDSESMGNRLFSIIHHEWNSVIVELFELGSLEIIDLPIYYQKINQNISSFIQHAKLKMLRVPNGATPSDLITKYNEFGLI